MTKTEADVGRCVQRDPKQVTLQSGRVFSNRCLLDEGHQGDHNYSSIPKKDELTLRRFLNNRSERGMI